MRKIERERLFGAGPPFRSLWEIALPVGIPKNFAKGNADRAMLFRVDIAQEAVPMLIWLNSLTEMCGKLDCAAFSLTIRDTAPIKLVKSP